METLAFPVGEKKTLVSEWLAIRMLEPATCRLEAAAPIH